MAKTTITSAFDPMTAQFDVFAQVAEETSTHTQYARVADGFQLVENIHPKAGKYQAVQYGERQLQLFKKGRADLMAYVVMTNGSVSVPVLTARADVPGGRISYYIGDDGMDHLCQVKSYGPGQNKVSEYIPYKKTTSHNPEAMDRATGFAKEDYHGKVMQTIQYEMLMSQGEAYNMVAEPKNSAERGVYLLGASIQRGGYWAAKPQVNKWGKLSLPAGSQFPNVQGGVHFLEFLGHMAQRVLTPVAWFVKPTEGYATKALDEQEMLKTPFLDGARCFEAWMDAALKYGEFGLIMRFGKK